MMAEAREIKRGLVSWLLTKDTATIVFPGLVITVPGSDNEGAITVSVS